MPRAISRKRPCRICRKWFLPNARLKDRQRTCSHPECKKEWHRKQCAKWNKQNKEYFKANYLVRKLKKISSPSGLSSNTYISQSRIKLRLPRNEIQEVIRPEQLVIIEYMIEQMVQRYQSAIQSQLMGNTAKIIIKPP